MCVPQLLRAGTLGLGVLSDSAHGVGMVFTGLNNVFHFLRCWRKDGKYGRNGGLIADKWGLKADICGFPVSFCLVRGDGGRLFRASSPENNRNAAGKHRHLLLYRTLFLRAKKQETSCNAPQESASRGRHFPYRTPHTAISFAFIIRETAHIGETVVETASLNSG